MGGKNRDFASSATLWARKRIWGPVNHVVVVALCFFVACVAVLNPSVGVVQATLLMNATDTTTFHLRSYPDMVSPYTWVSKNGTLPWTAYRTALRPRARALSASFFTLSDGDMITIYAVSVTIGISEFLTFWRTSGLPQLPSLSASRTDTAAAYANTGVAAAAAAAADSSDSADSSSATAQPTQRDVYVLAAQERLACYVRGVSQYGANDMSEWCNSTATQVASSISEVGVPEAPRAACVEPNTNASHADGIGTLYDLPRELPPLRAGDDTLGSLVDIANFAAGSLQLYVKIFELEDWNALDKSTTYSYPDTLSNSPKVNNVNNLAGSGSTSTGIPILDLGVNQMHICMLPAIFSFKVPVSSVKPGSTDGETIIQWPSKSFTYHGRRARVVPVIMQCSNMPITYTISIEFPAGNLYYGASEYYALSVTYVLFLVAYLCTALFMIKLFFPYCFSRKPQNRKEKQEESATKGKTSSHMVDEIAQALKESRKKNSTGKEDGEPNGALSTSSEGDRRRESSGKSWRGSRHRDRSSNSDSNDRSEEGSESNSDGDYRRRSRNNGHSESDSDYRSRRSRQLKRVWGSDTLSYWFSKNDIQMNPVVQWYIVAFSIVKVVECTMRAAVCIQQAEGTSVDLFNSVSMAAISFFVLTFTSNFVFQMLVCMGWGYAIDKLPNSKIVIACLAGVAALVMYTLVGTCPTTMISIVYSNNSDNGYGGCPSFRLTCVIIEFVGYFHNAGQLFTLAERLRRNARETECAEDTVLFLRYRSMRVPYVVVIVLVILRVVDGAVFADGESIFMAIVLQEMIPLYIIIFMIFFLRKTPFIT